jgi:molybdate transport system ATP-binding protein
VSELRIEIAHSGPGDFSLQLHARLPSRGVTGIFGPSGSGKTTLLDCIAGLRPDIRAAHVQLGTEILQAADRHVPTWRRGIGYVFQDARLFPQLSVAGNLDYAATRARGAGPSREAVIRWLDIGALLARRVETLSAGQAQRVAIARALLAAPSLLLLDEPLANLDRPAARHCLACLQHASRESGLPMLYVSHHIEEIAAIADTLLLLREGRVEALGPLQALLSRLDNRLADDDEAAAILFASASGNNADGLSELVVDGRSLYVPGALPAGAQRRLRVAARDVSVCRQRPRQTSILNLLEVTLEELRESAQSHFLLRLRLDSQWLLARITERSRRELQLQPGDVLYAQVKSTALLDEVNAA